MHLNNLLRELDDSIFFIKKETEILKTTIWNISRFIEEFKHLQKVLHAYKNIIKQH